jgi:hypothetical protein
MPLTVAQRARQWNAFAANEFDARMRILDAWCIDCHCVRRDSQRHHSTHPSRTDMNQIPRVTFPRLAIFASTVFAAGLVACSDSNTAPIGSTVADKGGAKAGQLQGQNQNQNEPNDQNDDNDNNNRGRGKNNANDTTRTEVRIQLVRPATTPPDTNADGSAKFEVRGTRMKLSIEGEHLTPGDSVSFFVGGTKVGTRVVGALGEAELELDTQHGDTIPTVTATAGTVLGTAVSIKNAAGATLVSGSF